jgi:hypothetical protein
MALPQPGNVVTVWSPRRSTTAGRRHPRAGVADKAEVTPGPAPCSTLPRLLALLTSRTAGLLNLADVSRTAGIPYATLQRHHLVLLERTFLVRQIDAWATNLGARVLKSGEALPGGFGPRRSTGTVTGDDFRGLRILADIAGKRFRRGVVLHLSGELLRAGDLPHRITCPMMTEMSGWKAALEQRITGRTARVTGVGMGYVGLSLAVELARAGHSRFDYAAIAAPARSSWTRATP